MRAPERSEGVSAIARNGTFLGGIFVHGSLCQAFCKKAVDQGAPDEAHRDIALFLFYFFSREKK
jgi:hypothetical protein